MKCMDVWISAGAYLAVEKLQLYKPLCRSCTFYKTTQKERFIRPVSEHNESYFKQNEIYNKEVSA